MKGIGFQKTGIVFSVALHVCCFVLILSLPKERFLSESEPIQVSLESLGSPARSGIAEKKRQGRPGPVRQRLTAAPAPPVENFERSEPEPLAAEALQPPPETKTAPVAELPASAFPNALKGGFGESAKDLKRQDETAAKMSGGVSVVEGGLGAAGGPSFIRRIEPVYPPLARRMGREGLVVLKLLIDRHGKLQDIEVVESAGHGFLDAAIRAVRQSTYAPARRNGQAVSAKAVLPIRFRLD